MGEGAEAAEAAEGPGRPVSKALQGFIAPRELGEYPSVLQLRKEIVEAAVKHSQKAMLQDMALDDGYGYEKADLE